MWGLIRFFKICDFLGFEGFLVIRGIFSVTRFSEILGDLWIFGGFMEFFEIYGIYNIIVSSNKNILRNVGHQIRKLNALNQDPIISKVLAI